MFAIAPYQQAVALIESAFQANTGQAEVAALEYIGQFVSKFMDATEETRNRFAEDQGLTNGEHLESSLLNRLFDYVHRCQEAGLAERVVETIALLDRHGDFVSYFRKLLNYSDCSENLRQAVTTILAGSYGKRSGGFQIEYDIDYVDDGHSRQCVDIYRPRSSEEDEKLPVVLYFHGGAWAYGDRLTAVKRLRHFAHCGVVFIAVGYRLVGEVIWPDPYDDCVDALEYVHANADSLGVDHGRIGLWGSSAGAHLAGLLAGGARRNDEVSIKALLSYCAPVCLNTHVSEVSGSMRELSPVMQLLGGDHPQLEQFANEATLTEWVDENYPVTCVVHGVDDETVPLQESKTLTEAIVSAGGDCQLHAISGCSHRIDDVQVAPIVREFFASKL